MNKNSWIALAYQIKETFKDVFNQNSKWEAESYLEAWCDHIVRTNLHPFHQVVKTFKRHWKWILSYIEHRITNWLMEWINRVIQSIKNRGRGYRNMENFITMIYLKLSYFPILLPTLFCVEPNI
jgi:transposase